MVIWQLIIIEILHANTGCNSTRIINTHYWVLNQQILSLIKLTISSLTDYQLRLLHWHCKKSSPHASMSWCSLRDTAFRRTILRFAATASFAVFADHHRVAQPPRPPPPQQSSRVPRLPFTGGCSPVGGGKVDWAGQHDTMIHKHFPTAINTLFLRKVYRCNRKYRSDFLNRKIKVAPEVCLFMLLQTLGLIWYTQELIWLKLMLKK